MLTPLPLLTAVACIQCFGAFLWCFYGFREWLKTYVEWTVKLSFEHRCTKHCVFERQTVRSAGLSCSMWNLFCFQLEIQNDDDKRWRVSSRSKSYEQCCFVVATKANILRKLKTLHLRPYLKVWKRLANTLKNFCRDRSPFECLKVIRNYSPFVSIGKKKFTTKKWPTLQFWNVFLEMWPTLKSMARQSSITRFNIRFEHVPFLHI